MAFYRPTKLHNSVFFISAGSDAAASRDENFQATRNLQQADLESSKAGGAAFPTLGRANNVSMVDKSDLLTVRSVEEENVAVEEEDFDAESRGKNIEGDDKIHR